MEGEDQMYDLVIIGGGAAGLSAALYAGRGGMKTLVIEQLAAGGQVRKTYEVDNYLGFYDHPTGEELAVDMEKHAKLFGAVFVAETVKSIEHADAPVKVIHTRKNTYMTKAIIFATGAKPRLLGVPGEQELSGMGVSYCATCDGAFFKGKNTVVVGGGNTAFEDALYLANFASSVTLVHRSEKFRAAATLTEQVKANGKIRMVTNTVVQKIIGQQKVEGVLLKDTVSGETQQLGTDAVFVAVGVVPESALAGTVVELCPYGFIETDMYMKTNVKGIFAAGDVRNTPLRQVITAAADGAVAATTAIQYVNELGIKSV